MCRQSTLSVASKVKKNGILNSPKHALKFKVIMNMTRVQNRLVRSWSKEKNVLKVPSSVCPSFCLYYLVPYHFPFLSLSQSPSSCFSLPFFLSYFLSLSPLPSLIAHFLPINLPTSLFFPLFPSFLFSASLFFPLSLLPSLALSRSSSLPTSIFLFFPLSSSLPLSLPLSLLSYQNDNAKD